MEELGDVDGSIVASVVLLGKVVAFSDGAAETKVGAVDGNNDDSSTVGTAVELVRLLVKSVRDTPSGFSVGTLLGEVVGTTVKLVARGVGTAVALVFRGAVVAVESVGMGEGGAVGTGRPLPLGGSIPCTGTVVVVESVGIAEGGAVATGRPLPVGGSLRVGSLVGDCSAVALSVGIGDGGAVGTGRLFAGA